MKNPCEVTIRNIPWGSASIGYVLNTSRKTRKKNNLTREAERERVEVKCIFGEGKARILQYYDGNRSRREEHERRTLQVKTLQTIALSVLVMHYVSIKVLIRFIFQI